MHGWLLTRIVSHRSIAVFVTVATIAICHAPCLALSSQQPSTLFPSSSITTPVSKIQDTTNLSTRRHVLTAVFSGWSTAALLLPVRASFAGEVGPKITQAVTTSDLGVSVRTSVVRGAQVMDQLDGKWEQFSDRFGLGAERSKQQAKPKPKIIPDPLPLDTNAANAILKMADDVFLGLLSVPPAVLERQIDQVQRLVLPSFERSSRGESLDLGDGNVRQVQTAAQFNFAGYVHFKAYSDLILQQGKGFDFNSFRRKYEDQLGLRLLSVFLNESGTPSRRKPSEAALNGILEKIDQLCAVLKAKGLLSLTQRSELYKEQLADWLEDTSELTFTIALDGDITLGSQMLLQEQGFRLYPDYTRFAVTWLLRSLEGQNVSVDDYYFDTDYNSDPDKFEVKEIVLNVLLDSDV